MDRLQDRVAALESAMQRIERETLAAERHGRCWRGLAIVLAVVTIIALTPRVGHTQLTLEQRVAALEAKLQFLTTTGTSMVISGANLQILNGKGSTNTSNAVGNLIIGYNEMRNDGSDRRGGSHNLVVGAASRYSSYGGVVVGSHNEISAPYACAIGGTFNTASGEFALVSGGTNNRASGRLATVSGGSQNSAGGESASVSGGLGNTASGQNASVGGGGFSTASGNSASVSGGWKNTASAIASSVSGGGGNISSGEGSSVTGGRSNTASGDSATVSGGSGRRAGGKYNWAAGGLFRKL